MTKTKKFKCWIEHETTINARDKEGAIRILEDRFRAGLIVLEFRAMPLKEKTK